MDSVRDRTEVFIYHLDPGEYTLHVKGSNNDGVWNEEGTSLKIIITPPWWATWWAKILYFILAVIALYTLYRYLLNQQNKKEKFERLQELDAVKTKIYTNISHEFRTPLTVILGAVEQIREHAEAKLEKGLDMIERNGNILLNLVNQLLELRKLESNTVSIKYLHGDILNYIKYILESFHSYAASKDIRLHFLTELEELEMDYDSEKMLTILSNLLSNAIKFTPQGGDVYVQVDRQSKPTDTLSLKISDTGMGIPPDKLPHIFDRFYQVDDAMNRQAEGTGIGLALTKELVRLLKGNIEVQSTPAQGTTFAISLPITQLAIVSPHLEPEGIPNTVPSQVPVAGPMLDQISPSGKKKEQPLALIIEDNKDVVSYLVSCLENDYRLAVAYNGQAGIDKALEIIPDLIISDVMMPIKDGFEVCNTLKNDEKTSHIPITLLTAKADISSKLLGLERGADAYLDKPFRKEELLIRMEKQLELRQKLKDHYLSIVTQTLPHPALTPIAKAEKIEDAFVKKLRAIVAENMDNSQFDVPRFCKEAGMSHSQLHRKLTALMGYSAGRFIRHIRLNEAKRLLEETDTPVSAVAFDVGYTDPGFFSKVFKDEFGLPPREYRKRFIAPD